MTIGWNRMCFMACMYALLCGLTLPALARNAAKLAPDHSVHVMTRAERLSLLDNVAELWRLHIFGISEKAPDSPYVDLFGSVENGQLSPQFVALVSLMTLVHSLPADVTFSRERQNAPSGTAGPRHHRFSNIPPRYDLFILQNALEKTAMERLGWPFQKKALAVLAESVKEVPDGLFVDTKNFYGWGGILTSVRKNPTFAVPTNLYTDDGSWFLDGELREISTKPDGIMYVSAMDRFHLRASKTDGHWRILSLSFDATSIR